MVPLGHYEDRRQARRVRVIRGLFVLGLLVWTSLAAWWATYFYQATAAVRASKLETYHALEMFYAFHFPFAPSIEDFQATLPRYLAVAPLPLSAEAKEFPFVEVPLPSEMRHGTPTHAIVVSPAERASIRHETHEKTVQLEGEGSLLIGLLFVLNFALYRMLMSERRLSQQRESFVHAVTHELKSPIAGLRALLESLATIELPAAERASFVELGLRDLGRLDAMVGNILLSARLEAKGFQPQLETVSLDEVLARVSERKTRLFVERGGKLSIAPGAGEATADPEALETVLGNLLDNALKYTAGKPEAQITVSRAGARVELAVQDNGIGLSRDDQKKVFEKFYRAPAGEQQTAKGTGLGLFIARGLARACGGDLTVDSAGPGRGSRFTVILPA